MGVGVGVGGWGGVCVCVGVGVCVCVCELCDSTASCQSLQSALSYVRGLFSFTSGRLHDAKRQLRETLTVANSSDLNKLTSCSLLLLGQIFLALGNTKVPSDLCHMYCPLHDFISQCALCWLCRRRWTW